MIPWYAWAYLMLLCLIGAGGFLLELKARRHGLAVLRLAAIIVLGLGVTYYFRGSGAGIGFALALLAAVAVRAHKSWADARTVQRTALTPAGQLGVALGDALMLPAVLLGTLAWWMQRGG